MQSTFGILLIYSYRENFNRVSHLDPVRGHEAEHGGSVPALLVTDDLRVVVIRPRGDGGLGAGGLGSGGLGAGGLGAGGLGGGGLGG